MKSLILLFLIGLVASKGLVNLSDQAKKQINGLKKLLKNLDGIYPTCKLVLFSELVDYDTADERCKVFDIGQGGDIKGNLATVNNDEKNTDLKVLLEMAYPKTSEKWANDQWVWVGLRKTKNNDGSKKGRTYNAEDWTWADGSSPNEPLFEKWMRGQPDQKPNTVDGVKYLQNQMRINHDGVWDDTFKYKTHPYACDYQGKYILSATQKTWSDAKKACEEAGLTMAKVRNAGEVEEMIAAGQYFLGERAAKKWEQTNWIWLGGNDAEEEGTWKWNDGEALGDWQNELPWTPKKNPDNAQFFGPDKSQNYLSFSKWGEFDDSYDALRRIRPFACQCPGT